MSREKLIQTLRRFTVPVLILTGGIVAGMVVIGTSPPVEEEPTVQTPRTVTTMVASARSAKVTVDSQGTVLPQQVISLVPQVSGEIAFVSQRFVNGGRFRAGELILAIDRRDYELAVLSAEAAVAEAAQQLETVRAQVEMAVAEWKMLDKGTPSALALRKPQLAGAEAGLKAARAELEKAQLMLERTEFTAPFDGVITNKTVDYGQYVSAGMELGELSSTAVLEIRLSIPERELVNLDMDQLSEAGRGLHVRLGSLSQNAVRNWYGRVTRTEGMIDPQTRNLVLVARVTQENQTADDGRSPLRIGQFVRAEIEGINYERVFELPRQALYNGSSIYVLDEESRLRARQVNVLNSGAEFVLVEDGLEEGDVVAVSPMGNSVEGIQVVSVPAQRGDS